MRKAITLSATLLLALGSTASFSDSDLSKHIDADYNSYLEPLFLHFHANPELSLVENETAARMAKELTAARFDVTAGVGGTGVVAILKNGQGPLVSMRADMDGLPVEELRKTAILSARSFIEKEPS